MVHVSCFIARTMRLRGGARFSPVWVLLAACLPFVGCDSESFTPSRPAELTRANTPSTPAPAASPAAAPRPGTPAVGARAIELIAAPRAAVESDVMKTSARSQAGMDKVRIQIAVEGENSTPGTQADLVRKAVARNPLAILVEPAEPAGPDLATAVAEARERGMTVVLVGRSPAGKLPEEGEIDGTSHPRGALIRVVHEPFASPARALVAAALNNSRNAKLSLEGGAIVLIDTASDPLVEDRAGALAAALRDAGVTRISEVRYASDSNLGEKKLDERLETDQKARIVLAADNASTRAAYAMANKKSEDRPVVVAGFTTDETDVGMVRMGEYAGIAAFSEDRMIRKAITTAAQAAAGQRISGTIEVKIPVHLSPADSVAPRMNAQLKSMMKSRQP
jgi:ABC-type sugar transport system substrate-binding protein